jgi:two-component system CheB/CheR fusion protein
MCATAPSLILSAVKGGRLNKKILIVDDNTDAADALGVFLKVSGDYDVRCAYNGKQAIELADAFRPDVVLLDINMPEVSGYDVARSLRDHKRAPRPRIIALTGASAESDRVVAKLVGFDHFLEKPVDHDKLLALLAA